VSTQIIEINGIEWKIVRGARRSHYEWQAVHRLPLLAKPLDHGGQVYRDFHVPGTTHVKDCAANVYLTPCTEDGEAYNPRGPMHFVKPVLSIRHLALRKQDDITEKEFLEWVRAIDVEEVKQQLNEQWAGWVAEHAAETLQKQRQSQFETLAGLFAKHAGEAAKKEIDYDARLAALRAELDEAIRRQVPDMLADEDDWTWEDGTRVDPAVIHALEAHEEIIIKLAEPRDRAFMGTGSSIPAIRFEEQS